MIKNVISAFLCLVLGTFPCQGNNDGPKTISPGNNQGATLIDNRCPTFSWAGVAWAEKYQIAVLEINDGIDKSYEEMASFTEPVLIEEVSSGALSWTPSLENNLLSGQEYIWFVGAMDAGENWIWSKGKRFRIEENMAVALIDNVKMGLKEKGIKDEVIDKVITAAKSKLTEGKRKDGRGNNPIHPLGSEGVYNTLYGSGAGANLNPSAEFPGNSFFGADAGNATIDGMWNTFMGYRAGWKNLGSFNTFMGYMAGKDNSYGQWNVFVGDSAGYRNTTGNKNTFLGLCSGEWNISGEENVFVGAGAGTYSTGSGNVFLGFFSGYNETGSDKLYIDNSDTASPLIYGDFSTDMVGINGWLGVGTHTPAYPVELKTTGRNAVIFANRTDGAAGFLSATASYGQFGTANNYPVRILVNSCWRMALNPDKSLTMASGATCTSGGKWQDASSRALKENIVDLGTKEAVETLTALNPVKFVYKADTSDEQVGFIAEDVPELVATKDRKSMSAMDVVAVLTKVVQEQQKAISTLKAELSEHKRKSLIKKINSGRLVE